MCATSWLTVSRQFADGGAISVSSGRTTLSIMIESHVVPLLATVA